MTGLYCGRSFDEETNVVKKKYPISKEFFPWNHVTAPVNPSMIRRAQKFMRAPRFLWKDPDLDVEMKRIPVNAGLWNHAAGAGEIELCIISPKGRQGPLPCLVDMHGGGFVFEASGSHYRMAMLYAKGAGCKVVFPRYRLAPDHPFPVPQEDCCAALAWTRSHAEEIGIDSARIGVAGDSAGGALAVIACMTERDAADSAAQPVFQLLMYPWLDNRNDSESFHRYTDTPMWNSSLSAAAGPIVNPHPELLPRFLYSPVEAESFAGLPPAYIEAAEFDCLHDDAILYARLLREAGVPVELHEPKGTMHGFDTKVRAPTSQKMIAQRIAFMRRMFGSGS